ncbi:MAG: hypothetical protein ISS66_20650, partial [Desulfobacteraceae bacterium]|nr:hypothetical protein [Desulfobacteraceae bacterium]
DDALRISEKTGGHNTFFLSSFYLGYCTSSSCEFERGIQHLNKMLEMSKVGRDLSNLSFINGLTAYIYIYQGRIDLAYQRSEESLRLAEKIGDMYVKGMAYSCYGASCYCKGLFDKAENSLSKAVTFCEKTTHFTWGALASSFLGDIYVNRREYRRSQDQYNKAISFLRSCSYCPSWINLEELSVARAKILSGDQDIDRSTLFKYHETNRIKIYEGLVARYTGEILLNLDDQNLSEAEDWIRKAIETNKRNGMMFHLGQDYALYAELFKRKSDKSKAKENLNKAIEIFKECGADGWVEKYEKELAALS